MHHNVATGNNPANQVTYVQNSIWDVLSPNSCLGRAGHKWMYGVLFAYSDRSNLPIKWAGPTDEASG